MKRVLPALVGVVTFGAACSKEGTAPVPVAAVTVVASSSSVPVGQTDQFTAVLTDAQGNTLTGRTVLWSASAPAVASVSAVGLVTALSAGIATVTATSEGVAGSATISIVPPTTTIVVVNDLVNAVVVSANGVVLGTVPALATRQSTVNVDTLSLTYDLVRTQTTSGVPVGDMMSGIFSTIQSPSGTVQFTIDNVLGTQFYFAPSITNNGSAPILMGVNWGLASQNLCNCSVPAFGVNVPIGYYRLYSNTEVVAFGVQSGYGNGSYSYWTGFQAGVAAGSGAVSLTNNTTLTGPPARGSAVAAQVGAWQPASVPVPAAGSVGPVYDHAMPRRR